MLKQAAFYRYKKHATVASLEATQGESRLTFSIRLSNATLLPLQQWRGTGAEGSWDIPAESCMKIHWDCLHQGSGSFAEHQRMSTDIQLTRAVMCGTSNLLLMTTPGMTWMAVPWLLTLLAPLSKLRSATRRASTPWSTSTWRGSPSRTTTTLSRTES